MERAPEEVFEELLDELVRAPPERPQDLPGLLEAPLLHMLNKNAALSQVSIKAVDHQSYGHSAG